MPTVDVTASSLSGAGVAMYAWTSSEGTTMRGVVSIGTGAGSVMYSDGGASSVAGVERLTAPDEFVDIAALSDSLMRYEVLPTGIPHGPGVYAGFSAATSAGTVCTCSG